MSFLQQHSRRLLHAVVVARTNATRRLRRQDSVTTTAAVLFFCGIGATAVGVLDDVGTRDPEEEGSASRLKPFWTLLSNNRLAFGIERAQCDGWFTWTASGGGDSTDQKESLQPLQRKATSDYLAEHAEIGSLEDRFEVNWDNPVGEGAFGLVYKAKDRRTGDRVAIKAVPRSAGNSTAFKREIDALVYLKEQGGHPAICQLRANYQTDDYFYFVLDLVEGGEMFDHLASHGPYSEADAARLIREIASALAFLHGIHMVHGDMKPENLLLSSSKSTSASVKLVDFGTATITDRQQIGKFHFTPGYCPPEYLIAVDEGEVEQKPMEPSFDMWGLAVIVYIMLIGLHPFDLYGDATDDELDEIVKSGKGPPLRQSRHTSHLSSHALNLLERLFERDPERRMTALQLLENDWVLGKTASQKKMANSDKKLRSFARYRTKIGAKLFAGIVEGNQHEDGVGYRTSLIERAFRDLDPDNKGYVTTNDVIRATGDANTSDDGGKHHLSLSGFSDLLAESMKNRYFDRGEVIYQEGDVGNHMYYIDSGTISVETSTGSVVTRGRGDFFGEGALLHPQKKRSATIRCKTPVHAMEISREYFEKYMKDSDEKLFLELTEKDKIRKRNRSKMILRTQQNLIKRKFRKGQMLFKKDQKTESIFLVEQGKVDITVGGKNVFSATEGNLCGEYSPLTRRPRNASAVCVTKTCECYEMSGTDFRALLDTYPEIRTSLHDLGMRRNFKKAVVHRIKKEFPYENPREAFDAIKTDHSVKDLTRAELRRLVLDLNPKYTDDEVDRLLNAFKLTKSESMSFDEFEKVFIADKKKSASI